MSNLSDFIGENDIYEMRDKVFKFSVITINLTNELKRILKQNDKESVKNNLFKARKN